MADKRREGSGWMEEGTPMAKHLDAFDELVVGLQTLGEPVDEARQLVVLLSSIPSEYELIASIVENSKDITLTEFKEKLLKEHEWLMKKETTEKAFRANGNAGRFKGGRGWAYEAGLADGATSHMTPFREDLLDFEGTVSRIEVTLADGKKLRVAGQGTVKLTSLNGKHIKMMEVLYIPGLDRRLLSVGKLADRGLTVEFQRSSCVIWSKTCAIASGRKVGKAYMLDREQEEAQFVEYAGTGSQWERWHARMGHLSENAMTKTQRITNVLKSKSEVVAKLAAFRAFYENQFGERLNHLRSDNETEFVNKKVAVLCSRNGIMRQCTVPYSPQQNGVAERMNRTITEKARSILYCKGVSTMWWSEAVKPRLEHLRVFGSLGYGHIDNVKSTKLKTKRFRCMFLGYVDNAKGYRVYDLEASKVKISRSVKLHERKVGGIYGSPSSQHHGTVIHVTKDGDEGTVPVDEEQQSAADEPMKAAEEPILDVEMDDVEPEMNVEEVMQLPPPDCSGSTGPKLTLYHPQPEAYQEDRLVFHPESERSRRSRETVFLLENGQYDDERSRAEGSNGPPSPKRARIDEDGLIAEAVMAYVRKAMNAELYSHEKNATWTLVPRGPDKRTVDCRWVFAKKRDENGRVTRYKARLVAKGFRQKYGIDFFETYSPVANMDSIRMVLAVCVAFDYLMEQLDADTAFLNSSLSDIVYMEIPHGMKNAKGMVCKLLKAIYGLKQAASAWNKTIHRVFLLNDFKSCGADQCGYVDDMIIAAKTVGEISEVKGTLNNAFKMKELGTAKFILGMEINHDRNASTLMIKQTRYIDDVAQHFGQKDAKPVGNPCSSNLKLSKAQLPGTVEERIEMQSKPYRSLIGCLLYITTCTRPDIAYIVTQLSRFLENPGL
ncbi:Polyprotein [Phytophthora palmivora]|uniref:Polyprotein n=1 Tax=Phytophthora palmivora TaxID=4796 RepID=A0A2P4XDS9_9STRA|nr:Polyprotein [Phytophthora palmivora]